MPYPSQTFATVAEWEAWVNQNIIPNGSNEIDGNDGNITENAAVKFIKQSPVNWNMAKIVSGGGAVALLNGITVIMTTTPTSLTWGDNFFNEWYVVNMTPNNIPLLGGLVYYDVTGSPQSTIPFTSILHVAKAENGLWVQLNSNSGSGGSTQKQPLTYVVGTTANAPTAGTNTWQLSVFQGSYVVLFINNTIADLANGLTGGPYISKPLNSDTLSVINYTWNTNDVLTYILITP